jgi:hypothetical protein
MPFWGQLLSEWVKQSNRRRNIEVSGLEGAGLQRPARVVAKF